MTATMQRILGRSQPGTRGGVAQHVVRGEAMRVLIAERFGVARPEGWQAKHLRWALERGLASRSPATRYHYWLSARVIAAVLGHWPAWEPHLRGPWTTPTGSPRARPSAADGLRRGGRPPKLAARHGAGKLKIFEFSGELPAGGGG